MSNLVVRAIIMLIGTTVFEVVGLIGWLELDAQGLAALGFPFLFGGLVLERLVITGIPKSRKDLLIVLGTAWIEYAAWALWFVLITEKGLAPIAIFILVLLPGLHIQHAFVSSQSMETKTFTDLVQHPGFLFFSLIEAVGGAIWLTVVLDPTALPIPAHLIIIVAITLEHIAQGGVLNAINNEGAVVQMAQAV